MTYPVWRQGLIDYTWSVIPAASQLIDIRPGANPAINPDYPGLAEWEGNFESVVRSWCGACLRDDSTAVELHLPLNGGHADYGGNEPIKIVLSDSVPAWTTIRNPSGAIGNILTTRDGQEASGIYSDGQARAIHSYNNPVYLPGVGPAIAICGGSNWFTSSGGLQQVYTIDPITGLGTFRAGVAISPVDAAGCYDASRHAIWYKDSNSFRGFYLYDITGDSWSQPGGSFSGGLGNGLGYLPGDDCLIWFNDALTNDFAIFDCVTNLLTEPPITGSLVGAIINGHMQPVWVQALNAFAIWDNSTSPEVINLLNKPTDPRIDTWTISQITLDAGNTVIPTTRTANGTYGRFQYSKQLDGFVLLNEATEDLYFFTLPSSGVQVDIGNIVATDTITIEYDAIINAAMDSGNVSAQFTVDSTDPVTQVSSNVKTLSVVAIPGLSALKSSNASGDANPGDTITYTVVIDTVGFGNLNSVVVEDEIADINLTMVDGSGTTDQGSITQDDTRIEVDVGVLSGLVTITYQCLINAGMSVPGTVSNAATVTSTELGAQNTNTLVVDVVEASTDSWVAVPGFTNLGFEADVLGSGAKQDPATDWANVAAWNIDDGTPAFEGSNVGELKVSNFSHSIVIMDILAAEVYRVTYKIRNTPHPGNNLDRLKKGVFSVGGMDSPYETLVEVGNAAGDWGYGQCYYAYEADQLGASVNFNIPGEVGTIVDDVTVEKTTGWHPAKLANTYADDQKRLGLAVCTEPSQVFNPMGVRVTAPVPGELCGGMNFIAPNKDLAVRLEQDTGTQQPQYRADGSIRFDQLNDNLKSRYSATTILMAPWTIICRMRNNGGSHNGWITSSANPGHGFRIRTEGLSMYDGSDHHTLIPNWSVDYNGQDNTWIFHLETGNSFANVIGETPNTVVGLAEFNFILYTLGYSVNCAGMDFWGMCGYSGWNTDTNDKIVAYLATL